MRYHPIPYTLRIQFLVNVSRNNRVLKKKKRKGEKKEARSLPVKYAYRNQLNRQNRAENHVR